MNMFMDKMYQYRHDKFLVCQNSVSFRLVYLCYNFMNAKK